MVTILLILLLGLSVWEHNVLYVCIGLALSLAHRLIDLAHRLIAIFWGK
jgi:type IV secretory pathway VirB3-like protein